jgi:hypothetical protein
LSASLLFLLSLPVLIGFVVGAVGNTCAAVVAVTARVAIKEVNENLTILFSLLNLISDFD